MPLEDPNNCWPANLSRFADALVAAPQFRTLVELPSGTDEQVARFVFGKRLSHAKDGHAWTLEELQELRHYGMVYGDPDRPFGKHLQNNARYLPHGTMCVAIGRLVPEINLVDPADDRTGLTDEHDRQWQNIAGTILDQMLAWLQQNGGPYPITQVDVTDDHETKAENVPQEGTWQYTEFTFQYSAQ